MPTPWRVTVAPLRLASCTAKPPTPPAAPWTSTRAPSRSAPISSICAAINVATGSAAASTSPSANGV